MKTVAAISFNNNHSLSMDVDDVSHVEVSTPIQVEEGMWCCEMLISSSNGTVALNLLADSPDKLKVASPGLE